MKDMKGEGLMIYTIDEIKARVEPVAKKYNLKAVYVFGSYARGEARDDSDVDLLIDANGSGLRGFAYGGLYIDLESALERKIDMIMIDYQTSSTAYESELRFKENVDSERKEIYAVA